MLKTGTIIAERYEILGKIGTGGMADVYKAKDHKLNRFVAVKVLKPEFREDTTFIRKFKSEAQAAAVLTHPNIVNVFDVGDDNGVYYIVMELIEGITLKEYISKKGKLGLYDTLFAPMIIYISTDILQIYVYKQFIDQIPYSLDESARMDGCSYFTIYWKIIFPLILPATATLIILKSVDILNDMYTPYLYMPSAENVTLTTMLMNYVGRSGSWAKLSAAIVLVMLPTIVMYLIFKKKILSGIVAGAVKE